MISGHGGAPGASPSDAVAVAASEPPRGGMTIAELWQRRSEMEGQTVSIRGTVVKYNGGILGRNWLHIQDGSGDAAAGDHDLTVTSNAAAEVGQVLTISGVVTLNQDFGSGYAYELMLTEASLTNE
jgi:hypothetical protein